MPAAQPPEASLATPPAGAVVGSTAAVRAWLALAVRLLAERRTVIDGLNDFPVPDRDTGSNVLRTLRAALRSGTALCTDGRPGGDESQALQSMAAAVLRGARGSSGSIVGAMLAAVWTQVPLARAALTPAMVATSLHVAARAGRAAVLTPVEGTILTLADAVAEAASPSRDSGSDTPIRAEEEETRDWEEFASVLLEATAAGLEATRTAGATGSGRVDAGAAAYVTLVEALARQLAPGLATHGRSPFDAALRTGGSPSAGSGGGVPAERRFELVAVLRVPEALTSLGEGPAGGEADRGIRAVVQSSARVVADVVCSTDGRFVRLHAHLDDPYGLLAELAEVAEVVHAEVEPLRCDGTPEAGGVRAAGCSVRGWKSGHGEAG